MQERRIRAEESGQRLDKYLYRYLPEAPSGFLYKMLRKKNITVNGRKAEGKWLLEEGDTIQLFLSEETIRAFQNSSASDPLRAVPALAQDRIVYESDRLLLVNKPAGLLSQRASDKEDSLTEQVLAYLRKERGWTEDRFRSYRPGPANRLDRNTSGLVAIPLTLPAAQEMTRWFRDRALRKEYLVITHGAWQGKTYQRGQLLRDPKTRVSVVQEKAQPGAQSVAMRCSLLTKNAAYSLLSVELLTGKTHQIRAHLQALGYPVLGDPKYGTIQTSADRSLHRQALHAWKLTFPHTEGDLAEISGACFTAPLPEDMQSVAREIGFTAWLKKTEQGEKT